MKTMPNDGDGIWNGIDNGEIFENQEQHYDFSQLEDPEVFANLPPFDTLLSPPLIDFDQTYNSAGYYLPPPDGLYNHRTDYTTSDVFNIQTNTTRTPSEPEPAPELEPEPDIQWPILQPENSEICFGMVWKAQQIS